MFHEALCVPFTFITNGSRCKSAAVLFNPSPHTDDTNGTLNSTVYTKTTVSSRKTGSVQPQHHTLHFSERIFAADVIDRLSECPK